MTCPECNGEGEIEITAGGSGYALMDVPIDCGHCDGAGSVPDDWYAQEEVTA